MYRLDKLRNSGNLSAIKINETIYVISTLAQKHNKSNELLLHD